MLIIAMPVIMHAQYSGGNGRGDVSVESLGILTKIDNPSPIPSSFSLQQNFPNPFKNETTIQFSIPGLGDVTLIVYDITGREIQNLFYKSLNPGTHTVSFDGSQVNSGVYFYKIFWGDHSIIKRMILDKSE